MTLVQAGGRQAAAGGGGGGTPRRELLLQHGVLFTHSHLPVHQLRWPAVAAAAAETPVAPQPAAPCPLWPVQHMPVAACGQLSAVNSAGPLLGAEMTSDSSAPTAGRGQTMHGCCIRL